MAKKAKKSTRSKHTPPKRRRVYIFPYVVMALLIIGLPLGIYQIYQSNVDRNIEHLEEAIKTYDLEYLEKNTDRLPIILDVLKKSYSEDAEKQDQYYKNNFANLEITVLDSEKSTNGKDVNLEIANVNYIDVFDKIPENDSETRLHADYMAALADPNQERNMYEAKIHLERKFSGYKVYESKEFINAILGGALDYADDMQTEEE